MKISYYIINRKDKFAGNHVEIDTLSIRELLVRWDLLRKDLDVRKAIKTKVTCLCDLDLRPNY